MLIIRLWPLLYLAQTLAFNPFSGRNNDITTSRRPARWKLEVTSSPNDSVDNNPPPEAFPPATRYTWRGHSCAYRTMGSGPIPILLIHGFAGSSFNCWRSTLPHLSRTHTVYGIDLLGLGASDQPADVEYGIGLWTEQCDDFWERIAGGAVDAAAPIVVGHSFGSCIALELAAAWRARGTPARAVAMMNCGCGMNNKNGLPAENWRRATNDDGVGTTAEAEASAPAWQFALFGLILGLVDVIFNQKWLLSLILERFATPETVRGALEGSVYTDPGRVTEDLVADYLGLATNREAAVEVLRQIYTNDAGPLPFPAAEALPDSFPILAVWGDQDNLASIDGPVGRYFRGRAGQVGATCFEEISAGHVPQDDAPEVTNQILSEWIASLDSGVGK